MSDQRVIVETLARALPENPLEAVEVVESLKKRTAIALEKRLREQDQWVKELEEENTVLKRQVDNLEARVTDLVTKNTALHEQLQAAR